MLEYISGILDKISFICSFISVILPFCLLCVIPFHFDYKWDKIKGFVMNNSIIKKGLILYPIILVLALIVPTNLSSNIKYESWQKEHKATMERIKLETELIKQQLNENTNNIQVDDETI